MNTVVYSLSCVERCNVLPKLRPDRQNPDRIEACIPGDGESETTTDCEWVKAEATESDGIITLSCEPTTDGYHAVYVATIEQYNEAWQAGDYHQSPRSRKPRCYGPCGDTPAVVSFSVRTTDQHLFVDLPNKTRTYQFQHDAEYGADDIVAQMVRLVTQHMDERKTTVAPDESFFDVLRTVMQQVYEQQPATPATQP